MARHTIWSNRNINPSDYQEAYNEHLEINGIDENRCNLWDFIHNDLENWLECEKDNLNIKTDGRILVVASLGLWDGRRQGYKILDRNINCIFDSREDYTEWYSDGYNIRSIEVHHDGVNYLEFREIREDRNIQNLLDAIYNGEKITRKKLNYYTKSLHKRVANVYGW